MRYGPASAWWAPRCSASRCSATPPPRRAWPAWRSWPAASSGSSWWGDGRPCLGGLCGAFLVGLAVGADLLRGGPLADEAGIGLPVDPMFQQQVVAVDDLRGQADQRQVHEG